MLGRTDSRLRMVAILLVFAVFATATGVRLGYLQVLAADEFTAKIVRPPSTTQSSVRADIVDRNGALMAITASYDELVAYPDQIDPDEQVPVVDTLDELLELNTRERDRYLRQVASEDQFESLRRRLTFEQSKAIGDAIDKGLLPGIALSPKDSRWYPDEGAPSGATLAANILGFVRADGRGGEGIESYYDERLTTADPDGLDLASIAGVPGDLTGIQPEALQLTIDADLQKEVERETNLVRIADDAKSVSAIVMDPHTGAILAAASSPSYDANQFAAVASDDMSRLKNRLFSDQYEPGSVMKIFTVTAALDLGLVTPNTMIQDQAVLHFYQHDVHNSDKGSLGSIRVKDVIARSRNVATAKIAKKLAPNSVQKAAHRLYDLWAKVGLTVPTGVDVASEAAGAWANPDHFTWAPVDLANRAFGQGVSVTLPQLARGFSTLVNGGYVIQPHFAVEGDTASVEPTQVLTAKVAHQAKDILVHVTGSVPHYAKGSLIRGYVIGGKTGTAQIWDRRKWNKETKSRGDWKKRRFNHSFIGFVGGRKQEYVIAVRIEEPKPIYVRTGDIPLHIESYELFQMIGRSTIEQLDMRKSKDKNAGRPIIGTPAAVAWDPLRNREELTKRKQDSRAQQRDGAKVVKADKVDKSSPRKGRGLDTKADPEPSVNESP